MPKFLLSSFRFALLILLVSCCDLANAQNIQQPRAGAAPVRAGAQQQEVFGAAPSRNPNIDAEFKAAVRSLINSYRNRGVSLQLMNNVENALNNGGGGFIELPIIRINNTDPYGRVAIYFGMNEPAQEILGPGRSTPPIHVGSDGVFLRAYKVDQFGNPRVTSISVEQINSQPARFWDGDDFQYFTLNSQRPFLRVLNNEASLDRYRIEP